MQPTLTENSHQQLQSLIDEAELLCKDPLRDKLSIAEVCIYGSFKTDIMMAKMALTRNSTPLILHYIEKLKLHLGDSYATQEESKDIG